MVVNEIWIYCIIHFSHSEVVGADTTRREAMDFLVVVKSLDLTRDQHAGVQIVGEIIMFLRSVGWNSGSQSGHRWLVLKSILLLALLYSLFL